MPARAAGPEELDRALRAVAAGLAVLAVTSAVAVVPVHLWLAARAPINPIFVSDLLLAVSWPVVGALIARAQPRNLVAWLMLVPTAIGPYLLLAHYGATSALVAPLPGGAFGSWVAQWGFAAYFFSVPLVVMFFPDGRLPGPRWRYAAGFVLGAAVIATGAAMAAPIGSDLAPSVVNPFGVTGADWLPYVVLVASNALFLVGGPASLAALVSRWRRAAGVQREQLRWLVLGGIVPVLATVPAVVRLLTAPMSDSGPVGEVSAVLATLAPPVAIGIAILRHGLFDIGLVLNRTIVYGLLGSLVVGGYVALVLVLQAVAPGSPLVVPGVAVLAVAATAARGPLQRAVDRIVFRDRVDPYAVVATVSRLSAAASEPVQALQQSLDAFRAALRLPFVAFDGRLSLVSGEPLAGWRTTPATVLGREVGEVRVGLRRPGERWEPEERSAVAELATRAGTLAYAAGLLDEVARSRERLVRARDEERRRLRADLHDGLGPVLAGTAHQLDALARRLRGAGRDDDALVARRARDTLRATVREVRDVVHGLRPPALDQLGITEALRRLATPDGSVRVTAEELGELPAAVEVAAHAVAVAAAARASPTRPVRLTAVRLGDDVRLEHRFDGDGPDPDEACRVLAEHAAEVGGSVSLQRHRHGLVVRIDLPGRQT